MDDHSFQKQVCFLIGTVFLLCSCNGQEKRTAVKDATKEKTSLPAGKPKMTKTQSKDPAVSLHWNTHCSLQDKEGNLWFGTTGEGVYRYDGKLFTQFTATDGLNSNTVYAMLEDKKGTIWIGTDKGLCRFDRKIFSQIPLVSLFSKNEVFSIMQDKAGKLWFGTTTGVYCYNGVAFSNFLDGNYTVNENGLSLKSVQCMLEDRNGIIWFGSGPMAFEGLCRYDGKTLTNDKLMGDEGWIRNLLEDINGTIYIGTRHYGVWRYDGKNYSQFMEGKYGNAVASFIDKRGNVWFSGGERLNSVESADGIWCYNGTSFTNYFTKDGFGKYSAWSFVEDREGNIWIGTRNNGLYKYDGKTFTSFFADEPTQ